MDELNADGFWLRGATESGVLTSGWKAIHGAIQRHLKAFCDSHVYSHPHARQILFEIVGATFVERYYAALPNSPFVLQPPYMSVEARRALKAATGAQPSWNFCKYLVGKDGAPIAFYKSGTAPDSAELLKAIEAALE